MTVKFVNDLQTRVADVGGISAVATTVNITAGDGAKVASFVNFSAGEYCFGSFKNSSGSIESVKITNRSTDALTISRAADGDTALAWAQDDILEFGLCSAALELIYTEAVAAAAAALAVHADDDHHFEAATVCIFGQNAAPTGWTRKTDWQNNAMLCYSSSGNIGNGGSANPQSGHTHTGPSHTHGAGTLKFPVFTTNADGDLYAISAGGVSAIVYDQIHNYVAAGSDHSGFNAVSINSTNYTGVGSGSTSAGGTGATGANTAPYYQEVIAATKDAYS
jgi:hypothetical protein